MLQVYLKAEVQQIELVLGNRAATLSALFRGFELTDHQN